jgi:HAD superfamily hydrolase (TIGR01490 family)
VSKDQVKKNTAAFFDVDNTLVRGSTAFLYAKVAIEIGVFKRTDLWRMGWEQFRFIWKGENNDRLASIKDRALGLIAGASRDEMHNLMEKVWYKEIERKVWPEMVEIVQHHLSQGREVWLITASPKELGELIAEKIGATGALGTVVEHKDGVMTGKLVGPPLHGAEKAKAARKLAKERHLSLRRSWAYSDSRNDLPLLTLVKHPVAVNPDKILKRHAKLANWQILNFTKKDLKK